MAKRMLCSSSQLAVGSCLRLASAMRLAVSAGAVKLQRNAAAIRPFSLDSRELQSSSPVNCSTALLIWKSIPQSLLAQVPPLASHFANHFFCTFAAGLIHIMSNQ